MVVSGQNQKPKESSSEKKKQIKKGIWLQVLVISRGVTDEAKIDLQSVEG